MGFFGDPESSMRKIFTGNSKSTSFSPSRTMVEDDRYERAPLLDTSLYVRTAIIEFLEFCSFLTLNRNGGTITLIDLTWYCVSGGENRSNLNHYLYHDPNAIERDLQVGKVSVLWNLLPGHLDSTLRTVLTIDWEPEKLRERASEKSKLN